MRDTTGTAPLAPMEVPTSTGRRNGSWRWVEAAQRPEVVAAVEPRARARARSVLVALAAHADERGHCWPSREALRSRTDLAPRTITRALADLEDAGLIRRHRDHRQDGTLTSYRYRLAIPTGPSESPRQPRATSAAVEAPSESDIASHTPLRGQITPQATSVDNPRATSAAVEAPSESDIASHTPLRGQITPQATSGQPPAKLAAQELPKNQELNPTPPLVPPGAAERHPDAEPVEAEDGRARVSRSEQAHQGAALDGAIRARLPGHLARSIPRTHAKLREAEAEASHRAADAGVSPERVAAHVVGGLDDAKDPGALLAYRLRQLDPATLVEVARHEASTRGQRAENVQRLIATYDADGAEVPADLAAEARALGIAVANPAPTHEPRWTPCPPDVRAAILRTLGKLDERERVLTEHPTPARLDHLTSPTPTPAEPVEVVEPAALVEPDPEPVEVVAADRAERVPASPEVAAYAARLATLGEQLGAGLGGHPTLGHLAAWPSSGLARQVEDMHTAAYLWVADLYADPDALDHLDALRRGEATDAAVLT